MLRKNLLFIFVMSLLVTQLHGQKVDMNLFQAMKPRNIGPAGMSGRVTAIAADPRNTDIIYVGTASGGLWKTTNAGTTFNPVFDDQPVASIGALAVDPLRPDVIWAGTGEGNPRNSVTGGYGIYKSVNGGKTWMLMGLEATRHIHKILVNPNNSDIVYAGAIGSPWAPNKERGLFKTTDGGKNWEKILYTNDTTGVCDMVMDPTNPDKIFVGMWNHQRWPWYLNSGGSGSGLYMTLDGGKTFTRLLNGIPDQTGRIGLAIANSRPDYVYAYVEAKPSAIYRSTDGGFTWEKRGERGIGNRPFYYAEIYADPKNENRLYTLYSSINVSEDGGLTFPKTIGQNVHSDHHAWWFNPENPRHMIDGNDGGLAITYDMGEKWTHITNLPLGQFYHLNVDMEEPYRIYGGLQDNGSWVGPGYTWNRGGILNEEWVFMMGGDGFDAMPVPGDPRYCYGQSQGGSLQRADLLTGSSRSIRPTGERGERLRFNWNSALAQDPFDNNTIYFGSQFVHKSTNRGDKWEKISPDLTTNDAEKISKAARSGGITIDATGAETHCTVITISPSKVQKGLIWAGTDDGNVQYTTDGGKTWINVTDNMKAPKRAWVPQVNASSYNAAEAFVVINNYRLGDYSSYLYYTRDFGKTWVRMIDNTDVSGYVLCFVQDPVEPKLMFAGTEYGLYVSFDKGEVWNKWTVGYPTVSTYDLVIHPRENDLVIATFGRSIWSIDNIVPLRDVAKTGGKLLTEKVFAFNSSPTTMATTRNLPGYYFRGDAMYEGDNKEVTASLMFYASEEKPEKLKADILNNDGVIVRTLEADVKKGVNKLRWRFDTNPIVTPGQITRVQPTGLTPEQGRGQFAGAPAGGGGGRGGFGGGASTMPGDYTVKLSYNGGTSSSMITLKSDPRLPAPNVEKVKANLKRVDPIASKVKQLNEAYQKFYDCSAMITKVDDLTKKNSLFAESLKDLHPQLKEKYDGIERKLSARPDGLFAKIGAYRVLTTATTALTEDEEKSVASVPVSIDEAMKLINDFLSVDWVSYQNKLTGKQVPLEVIIK